MSVLARFASLVKFEHTIFALPFAYVGMALAADAPEGTLSAADVLWITVAMVGARSLAMAINRFVDAEIDARNPRTAIREIPSGALTRVQVTAFMVASMALLVMSTAFLDPITQYVWPIPVALFVLYPYTKRFTWLCHMVLGICVGLAPTGAWLAIQGDLSAIPIVLTASIALWVAGFDVIYASQDAEIDHVEGLKSIPVRFGLARGLVLTRVAHIGTVVGLTWVGVLGELSWPYFVGVAGCAALLAYENAIVSADDMSRADAAFFTINGFVGILYAVGVFSALALS